MKEYIIETDAMGEPLTKELRVLAGIEETKELPKGEPRAYPSYSKGVLAGYKECEFCGWRDKCYELDGKKKVKI